ncbi:MAG: SGNH/GDSL hydrolase family protein [Clostridia bacterium]|nr:SGNH/GDSL hydrolase family protein [Clostridia bacterium]
MKKALICLVLIFVFCFSGFESAAASSLKSAPVLKETTCYAEDGTITCTVVFNTKKGEKYRVYRRPVNSKKYTKLGDVVAKTASFSYRDKTVKKGKVYYYTVRRVYNNNKSLSQFDATGIKAICFDCQPQIKLTTMYATLTFLTTPQATKYEVYRKFGKTSFVKVATLQNSKESTLSYTDLFSSSLKTADEKKKMYNDTFVDPTNNPFRYEVRAIFRDSKRGQISRGYYDKSGTCVIGTPAVAEVTVSGSKAKLVWSGIQVAKSYNLYAKTSKNATWKKLAVVKSDGKDIQRYTVSISKNYAYYTVRAFAISHGKLCSGGFETDFCISNRKYAKKKALFLGDSISLGRPYKGESLQYFSYAKRVEQLLGMRCDNVAITACTISENFNNFEVHSILTDQLRQIYQGTLPNIPDGYYKPEKLPKIWEYDYVVLQGGTNDYNFSVALGEEDSAQVSTYNGAINRIKEMLVNVNNKRKSLGLAQLKVIVLDIPCSMRVGSKYQQVMCRQEKKNKQGLTTEDYSNVLFENMRNSSLKVKCIETDTLLNKKNCLYESADNLHFTKVGYGKLGKMIAQTMLSF